MNAISRALALGALACLVVTGCSKGEIKKQTIEGTITYKGAPLQSGILRFVGAGGAFATAPIHSDGTFTITDVVPGEIQVGIMEGPRSSSSSDGKGAAAPKTAPLPAKYKDPEHSGLKYTIDENTKKLNIELK
ncbi:hypothetical protein GobsT_75820 [Gemmata obscuriglobus]|uniref:Carboxypeptidase regulatory-like domain-containing protein n=1 Tax=Gemmata obscuriglobus TaxID=114 RepID=A0A2Z3H5T3_9BACT|nr:hypothetical protein [Gemmata obscuriglobus]AWM41383.1 hypothetical protein C1280_33200 [Gemmata obscuriglobus]QEG32723.1 hypothetical protein GobsT_75820 [Gemmata obscuriglobus]VTS12081.1 Uncharacterized protein OS=Planctomyces brasiliensis (strain ATCC 49424 / DSM 5305 / JCM 21570 / NBRC 103401 / IFAM 1448) GN=Plabr_0918 PE=4 SV=1 [Gemmata obscuriglobus UQM 2246]